MTEQTARIINQAADSIEANVRCQTHTEANGKSNAVDHLRQLAAEAQSAAGNPSVVTDRVLSEVLAERIRQDDRWGEQNHPDGTGITPEQTKLADNAKAMCQQAFAEGRGDWAHILFEEVREALAEFDSAKLRAELIQTAAVAVAWAEAIDRRAAPHASSVPSVAPVSASQGSEVPTEPETATEAPEGPPEAFSPTIPPRRTLTPNEYDSAWHAVEGAAGEEGADPGTVLHAVLDRLGIEWQDAARPSAATEEATR